MGSKQALKKRKSRESESESDDELANGLFDGVLSQSEDEEDYVFSDDGDEQDEEDADESGSEGTEGSEDDEEDEEDEDAILSDDIPSDADEKEEAGRAAEEDEEPEITEPGVDPKPKRKEVKEEKNYRVERSANGGIRYVYEFVAPAGGVFRSGVLTGILTARSTPSTIPTTRTLRSPSTRSAISP